MNKEEYKDLEIEVIEFNSQDVIVASGPQTGDKDQGQWG